MSGSQDCYTNQEEVRKRKSRKQNSSGSLKSISSKTKILGKKCHRNPHAVCMSIWEGVKPERALPKWYRGPLLSQLL